MAAIPMAQIDPQDLPPLNLGSELSLFCSDMGTRPEELEWLMWRKDGEPLITEGNVVVFPDTGALVLSNLQVSLAPVLTMSCVAMYTSALPVVAVGAHTICCTLHTSIHSHAVHLTVVSITCDVDVYTGTALSTMSPTCATR